MYTGATMQMTTDGLSKSFGNRQVVRNVNLNILPGRILGLLGPNAAGKSTIINMLIGQLAPSSGSITIDGELYNPVSRRGSIGVMPQDIVIWDDLTIKENLQFSAAMQNLHPKKIASRINFLVEGLQLGKELHTRAGRLSGGYKRRLNLANSIIHDPPLIFLDEPSPGVDPQTRRFLWQFIAELRDSGHALVLTDHFVDAVEELSDYVVIIDKGSMLSEGSVAEIKQRHQAQTALDLVLRQKLNERQQKELKEKFPAIVFVSPTNIRLNTSEAILLLPRMLQLLQELSLEVTSLSMQEASLEDLFIQLTGKELRE